MTLETTRWTVLDAVLALLAGVVAAAVALGFLGADPTNSEIFLVVLPAQELATLGAVWLISRRKGTGDLVADFGIRFVRRDWVWLVSGVAMQVALSWIVVWLTDIDEAPQEIARLTDEATGAAAVAAFLSTVLLVPVVEELVFRGLLLRAVERKLGAWWGIGISAAVFAMFHYTGSETVPILPALFVVGAVLGLAAVRTGRLGASMVIHAGFNLLPAIILIF
ncbi:MAG: CPBP family intramembrane metalloprotease [Acidimicrobiia bacterium]|nr:CPBP family intramembrane metalloprotease [Acidimicrobiia bacterium]MDH3471360.1 CPBP family intramembrane metalloprotease [Acidimicrobiia bacterium]